MSGFNLTAVFGVLASVLLTVSHGWASEASFGPTSFQGSPWAYPPEIPDGREEVYKTTDDVALKAWVFDGKADAADGPRPAVIFFFGGGWRAGTPMQFLHQARYLQDRGVTAVLCDYRVASRQDVKAVDCVEDAKSAVRWVRANSQRLNVHPQRICAAGGSAGGHIACCTGLLTEFDGASEDRQISSVPNAMALYNPAVLLAPLEGVGLPETESTRFAELQPRLGVDNERISPIHHVRADLPPTVIFHGKADPTVPFATVEEFTKRMKQAGNRCDLHGFDGAPHGFFNWRGGPLEAGNDDRSRDDHIQWHLRTTIQLDQFLQSLDWLSPPDRVSVVDNDNVRLRGSLANSRAVFSGSKKGHVAFLGGSITEMEGYRPRLAKWIQEQFPETRFTFTNAGIASTCSHTGAMRLTRDVLDSGPVDLLFVEFAVNDDQDAGHDADNCLRGLEGILRQLWKYNPNADVVMTHFVNPEMLTTVQNGEEPLSAGQHERLARYYQVSSVYLSREVASRISAGSLTWEQFGGTHPGPIGNQLAADLAASLLTAGWKGDVAAELVPHEVPAPLLESCFDNGRLLSHDCIVESEGWQIGVPDWDSIEGSKRGRFLKESMVTATEPGAAVKVEFSGRAFGAYLLAGPDAGRVEVRIDGGDWKTVELYHHYSKGLHYPRTVMFAKELPAGTHTAEVRISTEHHPESKGTAARVLSFVAN
ncbi:MAG: alpha/beta hydrolase fold domain-containing protein [Planctomycetaceae bacterium]|nr:alpha/beta hydrolase fold domain-containing protein [Planctomycetaceae bacterium]